MLAWDASFKKFLVQTDSQTTISLIEVDGSPGHQYAEEIFSIRDLIHRDWEVVFSHIYCEGNYETDFLAQCGHSLPIGVHPFSISDCNLVYFLRRDGLGIAEPRAILEV
ncbi:Putative ribonuclease H protein At1g65750 [Linum perenne]